MLRYRIVSEVLKMPVGRIRVVMPCGRVLRRKVVLNSAICLRRVEQNDWTAHKDGSTREEEYFATVPMRAILREDGGPRTEPSSAGS
jgi:hypothetical protein